MEYYCYKCGSPLNEKGKCPQCDENFYCYKCGEKLNEMGKCPKCDAVSSEQTAPQPQAQATDNSNVQQQQPVVNYQKKPSVFVETFKQVWKLICNFFSRNTIDAVSEQYKENLPIWAIILSVPVLLNGIYAAVMYSKITSPLGKLTHINISQFLNPAETMLIAMFANVIEVAALVFCVYFFSKIQKKPMSLRSSANLVAGAYIPIAICSVINVTFGLFLSGSVTVISTIANFAFIMLLSASLSKAHNLEKPYFWRVLAVYGAVCIVTVIITCMVVVPYAIIKTLLLLGTSANFYNFVLG